MIPSNKNLIGLPWIAAVAFLMQSLDATILNTALPAIASSLNRSPLAMQSAVISYMLTVAILIPTSGWLADKFGTKRVFVLAVTLFTVGSLLCALSSSLLQLVISRVLQGIGGAIMMPVARLALLRAYPRNELLPILNFVTTPGLIGPILGPLLGGWLVTYATWHWIFLINIPIGIAGIIFAQYYMPNFKGITSSFDINGFLLFSFSLFTFSSGIELLGEQLISVYFSLSILLLGIIFLILYIRHTHYCAKPLIDINVFKKRTFSIGIIGNIASRLGTGSIPFLIPLMLQIGFGYPALIAGLIMAPFAIGSLTSKIIVVRLLKKFSYRNVLSVVTFFIGCMIVLFALQTPTIPLWVLVFCLFLLGVLTSTQFTSMNTLTLGGLSDNEASAGNSLLSATQQLSISFGVAVSAAVLHLFQRYTTETILVNFHSTFIVMGLITIISSFIFMFLKHNDGDEWRKPT